MEPIVLFKQGMLLVVLLTAPPLIVAVVVGVLTSLVQALMQIQDQTLPFGIKLVAVGVTLIMTGRWIGVELIQLINLTFEMIGRSALN
ncbi:EscS/YscS/HrcS family type III secretion system export apparatus protein [Pseudomonas sp. C 49-2]|jgi:type III secretion protein S|uniref:EscS/YscS/HrcS family type III secretion system export apparatus protein n=1 Tax=Pseudomonas canadensis TaxID=915099 RepID=A0A423EZ92_9PSED|nr:MULTISPECIES: type III secretion system export apparatus subunit SctS [Pseudomonas]CRM88882.1 flagellar biosynthesis protein FliQ [Pseudomonas sp. 22 E 5]MCF5169113.1 EscS/YscS/HrcS family type III secretion system export apparatus protein [Pseudomonas canadensis]MCF5327751.1 EscS/YscS/HrcS family type III secretion system export apparatus protein [Pseudomonas lurida]MEB2645717.1 type III secretion system export apparatus subunit SctS [Pseudomonas canadensis]ROM46399.1 EscS/YscS/HrcS family